MPVVNVIEATPNLVFWSLNEKGVRFCGVNFVKENVRTGSGNPYRLFHLFWSVDAPGIGQYSQF